MSNEKHNEYIKEYYKLLEILAQEEQNIKDIQDFTAELKKETYLLEIKLAGVKAENQLLQKQLGWEGITDEEMKWAMKNIDIKNSSYIPSLEDIRNRINKEKG